MKVVAKFLSMLTLAFVAGTAMPAHALQFEYDYPDQASIDSRAVGTYHQFNFAPPVVQQQVAPTYEPKIAETINFETKEVKLSKTNRMKVHHVAHMLKNPAFAGKKVIVTGFTDNVGKDAPNQRLSYHRAVQVAHALVADGVPAGLVSAQGMGKANPVADNSTVEGRAANRRVTISVSDH